MTEVSTENFGMPIESQIMFPFLQKIIIYFDFCCAD